MDNMTLREFTDRYGQAQAGEALGTTQMAISKALAAGRNISVRITDEGVVEATETKAFPAAKCVRKKLKLNLPDIVRATHPAPAQEAQ